MRGASAATRRDRAGSSSSRRRLDQRRRCTRRARRPARRRSRARDRRSRAAAAWVGTLARERGHAIGSAAVEPSARPRRASTSAGSTTSSRSFAARRRRAPRSTSSDVDDAGRVDARRTRVEELTDRLARRDTAGAIRTLRGLIADGEPPLLRVVAFVTSNLRRALHVSELLATGLHEDEVASRLGMPPWLVAKQARRGSPSALEAALAALADVDVALTSSRPEAGDVRGGAAGDRRRRRRAARERRQPFERRTARVRREMLRAAALRWIDALRRGLVERADGRRERRPRPSSDPSARRTRATVRTMCRSCVFSRLVPDASLLALTVSLECRGVLSHGGGYHAR